MKIEGIITPIVTPFHRDERQSLNYEALHELIDRLIEKGVSGIFILGSNGEFHVTTPDETVEMTESLLIIEYRCMWELVETVLIRLQNCQEE